MALSSSACDGSQGCSFPEQCNPATNQCVDCLQDFDCLIMGAPLDQCVAGVCRDCDFASGADAGCTTASASQRITGDVCVECDFASGTDAGCALSEPRCKSTNVCVECLVDTDCDPPDVCNMGSNTCG